MSCEARRVLVTVAILLMAHARSAGHGKSVLGRYRNPLILVAILFLQVLGLAVQVKPAGASRDHGSTRLIRIWTVGAFTPLEQPWSGPERHLAASGTTTSICAECAENRELKADRADAPGAGAPHRRCGPGAPPAEPCWLSRNNSSRKPWPRRSSVPAAANSRASIYIDKGDERRH